MIVRKAGLADLTDLTAWGRSAHARSNYAECAPYNAVITRQFFKGCMGRNDAIVLVAKDEGVCGVLVGVTEVYPFSHTRFATDILFFADKGGAELLDAYLAWAKQCRVQIVESAPSQDRFEAIARMFERKGFVRCGGTFRKDMREN